MPHWEPGWWLTIDRTNAADTLARLESETEALSCLGQVLKDQAPVNLTTIVASAARRSVEALCRIIEQIEGMGYVAASGILYDVITADCGQTEDIDQVHQFLESVITDVLDDALESREMALRLEWAIIALERNPNIVNSHGQIRLRSQSDSTHYYIPVESIRDASAQSWCEEFAKDAANTIVSSIDTLEEPDEADERLGTVNRGVFVNDVLRRSVVLVILGHMQTETFENYEHAAERAREILESAEIDFQNNQDEDLEFVIKAYSELLRTARKAAAECTASAALEDCLSALIEK